MDRDQSARTATDPKAADVGRFDPKADSRAWPTVFPADQERPWVLIQTKPGAELRVDAGVRQRLPLADVYLPVETVWRGLAPKRKTRHERPLIRGYVFAALLDADLPALHEVEGVTRLVSNDGRPARIGPAFVERMRAAEAAGRFDLTRDARRKAAGSPRAVGDRVKIIRGPFDGFVAVVAKLRGSRRVQATLALFGRQQAVTVDLMDVEAVDADLPAEDRAAA